MMPILQPDLTDSQRLNINMLTLNTRLNEQQLKVDEHDKMLVRGNGEPSIQERLRNIEGFIKELRYWMKFVVGIAVTSFLGTGFTIAMYILKQMP